jgi:hypothetical protein
MKTHLGYLRYVLLHKWHVLYAGWFLRVPFWRLIIHDWTKFTRAEWGPYVRRFGGGNNSKWERTADDQEWKDAWLHHWTHNPHHWNYWCSPEDEAGERMASPMPETYVREMVADWYGAGMAQGKPNIEAWYSQHGERMNMHSDTRDLVDRIIGEAKLLRLFQG